MPCVDAYANAQDFAHFWCTTCFEAQGEELITYYLNAAASNIHAALASVNACNCTLAAWATEYLKKINLVEAGSLVQCRCVGTSLTVEEKRLWLEWADHQLELIRTSKIDVCEGETGADWPVVGWASQGLTERGSAEIIASDIEANS